MTDPGTRTTTLTRFTVNAATGKVTISRMDTAGRAIYAGSAVSFASSDLLSIPGDAGKRLLRITVNNTSGEVFNDKARVVLGNLTNSDAVDPRSQVRVTTLAGNGVAGGNDGPASSATFHTPNAVLVDGSGSHIYVADTVDDTVRVLGNDGATNTLAGVAGFAGRTDGTGQTARFGQPDQIAMDGQGNLFIADLGNNLIRRITPLGEVTTIAGTGTAGNSDGTTTADAATFNSPEGIAVSADGGRIYVSELNDIRLLRYATGPRNLPSSYTVTTVAGSATAGYADASSGQPAAFNRPYHLALAVENIGNEVLYTTDLNNNAIRRIDTPAGVAAVSTIAGGSGVGNTDGPGSTALFNRPKGIAALSTSIGTSSLFITEADHLVRLITFQGGETMQKGSYLVKTLAGSPSGGFADGDGTTARFQDIAGITVLPVAGGSATLYIADANNNRIRKVIVSSGALSSGNGGTTVTEPVRLLNADAEIPNQTAWAKNLSPATGSPTELQFFVPAGVSGFSFTAYVEADSNLINLPAVGANYVTTLAGDGNAGFFNGPGKIAEFSQPVGITSTRGTTLLGAKYRAFVAERMSRLVRAIDFAGNVTTLAGGGSNAGDGPANQVSLSDPFGVAVGPDGSVFFTDLNAGKVRRIALVGSTLTVATIAGSGTSAGVDGTGDAIRLAGPAGIAVDSGGTIYITDYVAHTVRKITYINGDPMAASAYYVTTLAGGYQTTGAADGPGTSARFFHPLGIAADTDGKVYVCDSGNHTIRALNRSGFNTVNVVTLAGVAGSIGNTNGIGTAARFNTPSGITLDTAHNLYISEFGNSDIRRISPQGASVTLAGSAPGFTDGPNGTFNGSYMISLEPSGNLLVSDYSNNAIRTVQRVVSDGQTFQNRSVRSNKNARR